MVEQQQQILIVAVVAAIVIYLWMNRETKEGYIDVKQSAYEYNEPITAKTEYAMKSSQFMNRPTYKSGLPPRFYAGDYKSELRGAEPPADVMGTTTNPLQYSKVPNTLASEGGSNGKSSSLYQTSGYSDPLEYIDPSEVLPAEDTSGIEFGRLASDPETYVYDRLIYANQKRRNLNDADWIRGDLPIAPDNRGWFQTSVKPHLDLRTGAMQHIGPDYTTTIDREDIIMTSARQADKVKLERFR